MTLTSFLEETLLSYGHNFLGWRHFTLFSETGD